MDTILLMNYFGNQVELRSIYIGVDMVRSLGVDGERVCVSTL